MSKKTRILALILAVIMLVGVMPLSLLAADDADASVTEPAAEETSVLDYLASKAEGKLYTQMAFSDLLTKIDGTTTFIANGSYGDSNGDGVANFVQDLTGATTTIPSGPGVNTTQQQPSLKWVNGEAQLLDSIVSLDNTANAAKTDITYTFSATTSSGSKFAKSGKTLYLTSYSIKAGEAYTGGLGRLRIYTTQTLETCVNGTTSKASYTGASVQATLFDLNTTTGMLKAYGTEIGIFSEDEFINLTIAYDYETDMTYLYVNGVYIKSIANLLHQAKGKTAYSSKTWKVNSSNHYDDVETWTSGQDTSDTSDDNYTKVTYTFNKIVVDSHYGTTGVFAGRWASFGDLRTYVTTKESVFTSVTDGKVDPLSYIDINNDPANGVFKIGDGYYYLENGIIQGNKTVKVDNINLVLDKKTGEITNYYFDSNVYTGMTASDVTSLPNTLKTKTNISVSSANNSGTVTSYTFAKDAETGAYKYIDGEGGYVLAAAYDGALYSVTETEGVYAFEIADESKVAATIDNTYGYAPLLDGEGNQVTFTDGETAVNVLAKAEVETTTIRANYCTDLGNNIYELTKKSYTSTPYYHASTTDLSLGSAKTKYSGCDYQIVSSTGFSREGKLEYVLTLDIKAGAGINEQTADYISFGKIRWSQLEKNSSGKDVNADENQLLALKKNAEDGKYHLLFHGVDCGVFSEDAFNNVTAVFTVGEDGNFEITAYLNGVNIVPTTTYMANQVDTKNPGGTPRSAATYFMNSVGVYFSSGTAKWEQPLMYIGNIHAYSANPGNISLPEGTEVAAEEMFNGYVKFEDGTYGKYENNALVADGLTEANHVTLSAQNVELDSRIGLNFYVDTSALASLEGAKAIFTIGEETQTVNLANAEVTENGTKLTAWLSSIQMNTPVTLEILNGAGEKATIATSEGLYEQYTYSVNEYARCVVADPTTYGTNAVNAVKSMVLYGAFAERYFLGSSDLAATGAVVNNLERAAVQFQSVGTVVTGLTVYEKASDSQLAYTMTATTTEYDGVDATATATDTAMLGGVQLVLDSAVKIRIALNVTEAPADITGGTLHTESDEEGNTTYYVDITDITVSEFNDVKEVTVDGNTVKVSVLAIAAQVDNNESSYGNDFADLVRALYGYYYHTAIYAARISV